MIWQGSFKSNKARIAGIKVLVIRQANTQINTKRILIDTRGE